VGDGEQDMANMSTAEKVRAKIKAHQAEIERLDEFLRLLEEFEAEEPEAPQRRRRRQAAAMPMPRISRVNRFKDLSLVQAAMALIADSPKRALDTHQIEAGLVAGGFETKSKDFYNTIHAMLHRESKKDEPGLLRDGKLWKLTSAA